MATFAISADRFVLPGATAQGGYLQIQDGAFGTWTAERPECEIVAYPGATVGPGLVDTHIHGFHNHATTDRDPVSIDDSSVALAQSGTTTWLPTTFTEAVDEIEASCAAIAAADEARGDDFMGARIGGIYLEGPFFSLKKVGAQNPKYLIEPSVEVFKRWQEAAGGRIVKSALAAEHAGADAYCAALDEMGVTTCIGHSAASYHEALAAVNAGATCFVHTYNGQSALHHRDPGCVGAAMTTNGTYAEIICDGRHVVPEAVKALVDAKGWQHTVLITDCTTGSIAGSVLTLAEGVKNMVDWQIVTVDQAIRMATEVPARSARIDGACGFIKPGRAADLTIFNADMTLAATYVGGKLVA